MAVIIDQVEQAPEAPGSRPRGDSRGGGSGAPPAPGPAEMIQALQRESSRRARLWAD